MRRAALLAVLLAIFAAAALAQNGGLDNAADPYGMCLVEAAKRFDDGRSDASTIAKAIMPNCSREFDAFIRAAGKGLDGASANYLFVQEMQSRKEQYAIQAVLALRKSKAK